MDSKDLTFERYWTLFNPDKEFENRQEAARQEWNAHPEKQESIIAWLSKHGTYRGRSRINFAQRVKDENEWRKSHGLSPDNERFMYVDELEMFSRYAGYDLTRKQFFYEK